MMSLFHGPPASRAVIAVAAGMALLSFCGSAQAAGDVSQAQCPPSSEASPGFRAFLPDCRAYELVSPPYTGGQAPGQIESGLAPESPDGQHLLGLDFAGFAGAGNEEQSEFEFGTMYEFSRTPSNPSCVSAARDCWSAEALDPPASLAAHRDFVGASTDLSRSLWQLSVQGHSGEEVTNPSSPYKLAVRDVSAGGVRFTEVGPSYAPAQTSESELGLPHMLGSASGGPKYEPEWGASHDLTHIVLGDFAEGHRLWPGDETREGHKSLYEYVGTANSEPTLVGVSNAGPLEGATHVNEHAELVSECGTILGSGAISGQDTGSVYNAVSASGATVYFTAQHEEGCSGSQPGVDELYARVAGSQTVDISEPSGGPEGDCSACEASTRSGAIFQGASEDGSKAFFLSEQRLLPGARGQSLYEYDFNAPAGRRVALLATDVPGVARISEDGSHVYFVSTDVLASASPVGSEESPEAGARNLYVYDTVEGDTAFIARLATPAEEVELKAETEEELGIKGTEEAIERENTVIPEDKTRKAEKEAECAIIEAAECKEEIGRIGEEIHTAELALEEVETSLVKERADVPGAVASAMELRTGVTMVDRLRPFDTTADGRFLAFVSARQLTGREDRSTVNQVFVYDAQTATLTRVSSGQKGSYPCPVTGEAEQGFNCDGNATRSEDAATLRQSPDYSQVSSPTAPSSGGSLSIDGAVVFSSRMALTPQAVEARAGEGHENIYEYRDGDLHLISPGDEAAPVQGGTSGEGPGRLLGISASGGDVFLTTTDGLVPQDTDTQSSFYDAREAGGFPAPASSAGCVVDGCQGPLSAMPLLPAIGGSDTTGGETGAAIGSLPGSRPKAKPRALTRAEKLVRALKACRKKPKRQRSGCVKRSRKQYGRMTKSTSDRRPR